MSKTLREYRELALSRGYNYILKISPSRVGEKIEAWECIGCETVYKKSYTNIKKNGNCSICIPISSKKKTLEDYKKIGLIIGIIWTLLTIPKDTAEYTDGFQCENGHILLRKRYKDIRERSGCLTCSGKGLKLIEDYHSLAKSKGIEFISNKSPRGVDEICIKGWKCKQGHIESATYHNIQKSTYGCRTCAGNKPKELKDYVILAEKKEFKYILDTIPDNIDGKVKGWKCKEGHIFEKTYHEISQDSGCSECCNGWTSQEVCVSIFEEIFGMKFERNKSEKFLGGKLQLDGYNEILKIGVEYSGIHHFKYPNFCHKNKEQFDKQQANDKKKAKLCEEHGVKLFIITDEYNYRNSTKMRNHIIKLIDDEITLAENEIKHLNL